MALFVDQIVESEQIRRNRRRFSLFSSTNRRPALGRLETPSLYAPAARNPAPAHHPSEKAVPQSAPTRNPSSPAHAKAPPEDVSSEGAVPLFSFASDHSLRIKLLSSARWVLQVQREQPERPVLRVLQEKERRLLSCLSRLR